MLLILLLLQNLKSEIGRCGVEVVWSNLRPAFADRAPTILQTFWSEWGNPRSEKSFSWNEKTFPKCKLNAVAQLYLLIFSAILLQCPSISFNETDGVCGVEATFYDGMDGMDGRDGRDGSCPLRLLRQLEHLGR